MKKRPVKTKEQREKDIRFIRFGPIFFKKYKKLTSGHKTKEDFVELLAILWGNLGKLTFKVKRWSPPYNGFKEVELRKYKNIPQFKSFNKYSRKVLVGYYSQALQLARKEGMITV